jgi:hypothetical protein
VLATVLSCFFPHDLWPNQMMTSWDVASVFNLETLPVLPPDD